MSRFTAEQQLEFIKNRMIGLRDQLKKLPFENKSKDYNLATIEMCDYILKLIEDYKK